MEVQEKNDGRKKMWCGLKNCEHINQIKANDFTVTIVEICLKSAQFKDISCKRVK